MIFASLNVLSGLVLSGNLNLSTSTSSAIFISFFLDQTFSVLEPKHLAQCTRSTVLKILLVLVP